MPCPTPAIRINPLTHRNMLVPCRKCIQCRIAQRSPWELRLRHELQRHSYIGSFVTMTYSDDRYDVRRGLNYDHLKNYWDSLRKHGYKFTYYCVGEYGSQTARCHYHALLFGIDPSERYNLFQLWNKCYYPRFTATQITSGRIRYTLKYMDKETCTFSDWSNLHPDKCKFLYHSDSGVMFFQPQGVCRPRAWLSKGLGSADVPEDMRSTYFNGRIRVGQSEFMPSHYYQDCISRNDIYYQYQRQFFNARNGVDKDMARFDNLNDYYSDVVSFARYQERKLVTESRRSFDPVDDGYLFSSTAERDIMNADFDNMYFTDKRYRRINKETHFPVSDVTSVYADICASDDEVKQVFEDYSSSFDIF